MIRARREHIRDSADLIFRRKIIRDALIGIRIDLTTYLRGFNIRGSSLRLMILFAANEPTKIINNEILD
jgi:hypothetical protein